VLDFFLIFLLEVGRGTFSNTEVAIASGGGGTFLRKSAKLSSSMAFGLGVIASYSSSSSEKSIA
jgi:hypothetical protein